MKVETLKDSYQLSSVQQELSKAEGFWRQLLHGFTAPTPVVVDQAPQAPRQERVVLEQEIRLSKASTSGLQSLAQQHQLTLNTVVQGAWALLLWYEWRGRCRLWCQQSLSSLIFCRVRSMVGLCSTSCQYRRVRKCLLPGTTGWLALETMSTPLDKDQGG